MSFLSLAFMFIFLPVVMGVLSITPRARRTNILSVIGIVFFVCINISDPPALLYISFAAAMVGVRAHGMAGDAAAKALGEYSLIASDIIDHIPEILK